jgi:hypothetical protein
MAWQEQQSVGERIAIVGNQHSYQAVILIMACVASDRDIGRGDVEAIGLSSR